MSRLIYGNQNSLSVLIAAQILQCEFTLLNNEVESI